MLIYRFFYKISVYAALFFTSSVAVAEEEIPHTQLTDIFRASPVMCFLGKDAKATSCSGIGEVTMFTSSRGIEKVEALIDLENGEYLRMVASSAIMITDDGKCSSDLSEAFKEALITVTDEVSLDRTDDVPMSDEFSEIFRSQFLSPFSRSYQGVTSCDVYFIPDNQSSNNEILIRTYDDGAFSEEFYVRFHSARELSSLKIVAVKD